MTNMPQTGSLLQICVKNFGVIFPSLVIRRAVYSQLVQRQRMSKIFNNFYIFLHNSLSLLPWSLL